MAERRISRSGLIHTNPISQNTPLDSKVNWVTKLGFMLRVETLLLNLSKLCHNWPDRPANYPQDSVPLTVSLKLFC